ncbi:MAG: methyltransferase domain-containing protein [candidate division Zixibacteria bacterium]|nr:methyltransferase domain-containing protein [candidate division Zixibacteria bacterium]
MFHGGATGTTDVRAYFERAAERFDRLYTEERQTPFMRWVNARFRRDIAERYLQTLELAERVRPDSVLDVGCGSGRYLAALAEHGVPHLVGVDLSEPMLAIARRETEHSNGAMVELHCADYMTWTSGEARDMVIAMGLFDYVDDPRAMLERMRRDATRAVIASFPSKHWFRTPLRKVRYRIKKCPVYFYDPETIKQLGHDAGYARVDVEKIRGAGMDYVATFWVDGNG